MKNREELWKKLREYGESGMYPFHMPGHKRNREWAEGYSSPFSVDITEIDGFDNLHHPEGILRDAMEEAAALYGTERTWFLVNGSTAGILAALSAAAAPGERILMARNSHRSAFHAAVLRDLSPVYVAPEILPEYGIAGGIPPAEVERILREDAASPGDPIRAVYLTSPTYEGVLSDIRAIAAICHRYGIPLIVDEAHGAHLVFGKEFGESALRCGADVVVQSVHKTLPALTQTALLHLGRGGDRYLPAENLSRWLRVYETSSPSYVLMASIDSCLRFMGSPEGREAMERYEKRLRGLRKDLGDLRHIRLLDRENTDPSKLVLFPDPATGMTGKSLADLLRTRYHLETEMSARGYLIAMTTVMDTEEGYTRLAEALRELDGELDRERNRDNPARGGKTSGQQDLSGAFPAEKRESFSAAEIVSALRPGTAWNAPWEWISDREAAGRICCDFVTPYPPGVPVLLPGEVFTEEVLRRIRDSLDLGLSVDGIREQEKGFLVPVLRRGGSRG